MFKILLFLVFQLTKLIVLLDRKFKFKTQFPRDADQLKSNQEWCIDTLKKAEALPEQAEIKSYVVSGMHQEIIYRSEILLITIIYHHNAKDYEFKCIAKLSPGQGTIARRAIYNLQQNHVKEVNFYKNLASKLISGTSPDIYYAEFHGLTANMCILMEYMAGHKQYDEFNGCPEKFVPIAIQNLAKMHAIYWDTEDKTVEGIGIMPPIIADFFKSTNRGKWSKNALAIFKHSWDYINVKQTIVHADSRVGNMMFHEEIQDRFVFLDWQAPRISKGAFDIAYFMTLSLSSDITASMEDAMLELYHKTLCESGINEVSLEELQNDYKHACIMVLTMLATPKLNGEGNFKYKSIGMMVFVLGHFYWHDRFTVKMKNFDYEWMASNYEMTDAEAETAIQEILVFYKTQMVNLLTSAYHDRTEIDELILEIEAKLEIDPAKKFRFYLFVLNPINPLIHIFS